MKTRPDTGRSLFTQSVPLLVGGAVPIFALWSIATDLIERQVEPKLVVAERVETYDFSRSEQVVGEVSEGVEVAESLSEGSVEEVSFDQGERPDVDEAFAADDLAAADEAFWASVDDGDFVDLQRELLAEAQRLAVRAERPWKSLAEVAVMQYHSGYEEDSKSTFELALSLAADPDDRKKADAAGVDVVEGLLRSEMVERAMEYAAAPRNDAALSKIAEYQAKVGDGSYGISTALLISDDRARDKALMQLGSIAASRDEIAVTLGAVQQISDKMVAGDALMRGAINRARKGDATGSSQLIAMISDDAMRDKAMERVALEHSRKGQISSAQSFLSQINDATARDRVLQGIAADRAKRHDGDPMGFASQINNEGRRLGALRSIAGITARGGDTRGALSISGLIGEPHQKGLALKEIAVQSVVTEGASKARSVVSRIPEQTIRDQAMAAVAVAIQQRGADLHDAWSTARLVREPAKRSKALAEIAESLAMQGDGFTASKVLTEAESGLQAGPADDELSMSFARAYLETERNEEALAAAQMVASEKQRDRVLRDLSERFARDSRVGYAIASSSRIAHEDRREKARSRVIEIYADGVRPEEAMRASERLPSQDDKVSFLVAVAGNF